MDTPFFKTTNGITKKFLLKNYPEYLKLIEEFVKEDNISISERIYLYQNKLETTPICQVCNSNKVKFIKFYKGYTKYCSKSCSAKHTHMDPEIKASRLSAIQECNLDPVMRAKMTEKANLTKSNQTQEQINQSNKKRQQTNLQKWGVENVSMNQQIKEKIKDRAKKALAQVRLVKTIDAISKSGFIFNSIEDGVFSLVCSTCQQEIKISRHLFNQRRRFGVTICTTCNPISNRSDFEKKILDWVSENYSGEILANKKFGRKWELDIFLPELNIGIECNGLWWHSEMYRDKNYHLKKTNFFKEQQINLINIWEDDWKFKKEIVKSRLKNRISKVKPIWARKCIVRQLGKLECQEFLESNHIQGACISRHNIGLFYNDQLVYVMTFGGLRKNLGQNPLPNQFELLRACSLINHTVVGGFSKCLNYFIKSVSPNKIISYCDRSFNTGNSYVKNGFTYVRDTVPNYYWFHKDEGIRINRWNFRKDKLVAQGFDPNKTEFQIMCDRGYSRIWDCGSYLFEINFD